jgi:putative PIN family toxin of toxin-antitoxin system
MIPKAGSVFRHRVVLDTNVCLDLFMFRDPRWQVLLESLTCGEIEAFTRHDCRREFELVLGYEKMKLSAESQAAILAEFDRLVRSYAGGAEIEAGAMTCGLPVCKDSDDQKFLELALACEADALITKDKALLKLARKTARNGQFNILAPQAWLVWFAELKCAQISAAPADL